MNYSIILIFFSISMFFLGLFFLSFDYSIMFEFFLLNINSSSVSFILLFDWMSMIFSSFVLLISASVLIYSKEYMKLEKNLNRFIMLVMLFVISMLMMILSPNLISILLGWDGLGLVSYCLVIYYQNEKSYNSGMLTILSNRIGDVAILMSICWMLNYGSWNCFLYFDYLKTDFFMILIMIMVMLASMTKSAQIPFSAWLPAAMAAPTPVSSLVHSSTLVTAGVYLLIRFSGGLNDFMMYILLFISVMTMFMAGLVANFEYDLKKIIAMSTLSQLGLMMSILCVGDFNLSLFHLLTHALFKALLFMCAGYIIHCYMNCQDIRYMGSLINYLPITSCYFIICNFSLCGLPFLSGFYSKDLIVELISMSYMNMFIYMIYMFSLGLTISYSIRLLSYLMMGEFNYYSLNVIIESFSYMIFGMSILVFFVIFSGSMIMWIMLNPYYICLPLFMKLMTFFVILMSYFIGLELFHVEYFYYSKYLKFKIVSKFFGHILNLSLISSYTFSYNVNLLSKFYNNNLDQGWFEYYGSKGLYKNFYVLIKFFQGLSINYFKIYFIMMLFWLMLVFFIL
uniref:NADH dehydrogenase subunit 5 n=1 Tax=Basiprionota bisignata TaxID=2873934 RepID=UPI001F129173|nr:NADH dehydrogenase subunit 5 [Basiprionota bisignata]UKS07045.1 NADH dehydrogenase subunit 5 [Basiprionota bisignata]